MALLVLHPGAASIDCEDCKRWVYDLETGKRQTAKVGPNRLEKDIPRPEGTPTPCADCPKKSPENAKRLRLTPANRKTYQLWRMAKATGFHIVPDRLKTDLLLARNFAELDDLQRTIELERQLKMMARMQ